MLCPYFRPQRPSVSFQSSPYNSCRDWSKTWCKFVDLFFLSFSSVNKFEEWEKHVGHKHTLRATQGIRPVTTAFREFVRDYWLRSYPAEAARALWREDINAGRILYGHTSYIAINLDARNYGEMYLDIEDYGEIDLTPKTMKRSIRTPETMERSTWTPKTMGRSTRTLKIMKRSTRTSKTLKRLTWTLDTIKRCWYTKKTMERSTWTLKTMERSTPTHKAMKKSTWTLKTI